MKAVASASDVPSPWHFHKKLLVPFWIVGCVLLPMGVYEGLRAHHAFREAVAAQRLAMAARDGDRQGIDAILKQGYSIDICEDESQETALMLASSADNLQGVQYLLSRGASVTARDHWHNQTALMFAYTPEIVDALLTHGADPNVEEKVNNDTPLHHFAKDGKRKIVLLLLSHGANPTVKNDDGQTPAMVAEAAGHYDVAQLLESAEKRWTNTNHSLADH